MDGMDDGEIMTGYLTGPLSNLLVNRNVKDTPPGRHDPLLTTVQNENEPCKTFWSSPQ
jgi:hypothetical protein